MKLLLRQPTVIDPSSPFHLQKADLLIENGTITGVGSALNTEAAEVIDATGQFVSAGWVDSFAQFCDPGHEFRETTDTGAAAAAAGGYTDVLVLPNTAPVLHHKSGVEYIMQRSAVLPVNLHPVGAITKNTEGKELAEMYDMEASGAVAFSDGTSSVQSAGLLVKALLYVKAIGKTIIQLPDDRSVNPGGLMHEGIVSTRLGLPGRPALAEELMVARDIELLKYTGSRLHITGISTAASVALIRAAKNEGHAITCSVAPYHLYFTDEDLRGYDTHLKVNPPLRTAADREALQEAVSDGTIDCIASHHIPQHIDGKIVEFENALPGMIGLQTAFAVVRTAMPMLPVEKLVHLFATAPRNIFGLKTTPLIEGAPASLTVFDADASWQFERGANRSRSVNSPFFGLQLKGKPSGIIHKGRVILNDL